jgi:tetrahydromethanopterin S-methyltransferase subunit G
VITPTTGKISGAYNDSFRERHETRLDEVNKKIDSVEAQISRLQDWIREDEGKL